MFSLSNKINVSMNLYTYILIFKKTFTKYSTVSIRFGFTELPKKRTKDSQIRFYTSFNSKLNIEFTILSLKYVLSHNS